ncbi:MAG: glycosyltransferase family 4 protein, partial [Desulfomonilia bacterium]|nr:glycosyltransferase family 4 protein [Desulfomonilia bacterium]
MKICILTTSFPLRDGDLSGIFMLEQGRHLVRRGHEVTVIAPHHPGAPHDEMLEGMHVHRFTYFLPERLQKLCYGSGMPNNLKESILARIQLPFLLLAFNLQAIIHGKGCDLIHAHWTPAGFAGYSAARILRKPVILNMHHGSTHPLNRIENYLLEHVDYVFCNSRFTLSHVMETATPSRISVIPPGVDIQKFQPHADRSENENLFGNIPADHLIILTIGRLIGLKGHTHLLEALRLLPDNLPFHLLVGGEGTLKQELEDQVKRMGLSERVSFLGHIPNHLTPFYYTLADIYVQPSIIDSDGNTEGLGVTLLEAMACETPCIGSSVGGIPDIIVEGENGFLV